MIDIQVLRWRNRKAGTTLYEMVFIVGLTTVVAAMSTALLHAVIRQQAATNLQLARTRNLNRLTNTLRDDVQRADSAVLEEHYLELGYEGRTVTWLPMDHRFVRTQEVDDKVRKEYFELYEPYLHKISRENFAEVEFIRVDLMPVPEEEIATMLTEVPLPRDASHVAATRASTIFAQLGRYAVRDVSTSGGED